MASYGYDALHRVTSISYDTTNAPGVATTPAVSLAYDTAGAVSSVSIGSEYTESYSFDAYHRVQSVTRWILGQAYDIRKTYTTSYEYNQASQLTKLVYPSGQQVAVNHDTIGRLQSLTDNPGDATGYVTGVSYTTAGQVSGLSLGNGVSETYGYDANRLQMTSQTATKSGTTLMSLTYSYQASAGQMGAGSTAGNSGQLMSVSGTINATTESASYTYDNLGRLVTSNQTSNGSSAQRRFAYDRWGNRTGVWDAVSGGTQIQSISLQQSGGVPTNRITSVTSGTTVNYSYDAAGNVTNDGAHSYVYDAENRLVSMDSGAAQYRYDQQNRRVCKIVGSAWTHYLWEGGQVIGEHDATTAYTSNPTYQVNSARVDYIYSGSRMVWSRQRTSSGGAWTSRYYLSDRLSVRVVMDVSGNVVGRQAHLPFGEDFAESGTQQKQHFTSYERDSESGTDYAINRQYNQSVGRFMRVDPYAKSSNIGNPQSLNRYSYSLNDATNMADPLGLDWVSTCSVSYYYVGEGQLVRQTSCTYYWSPGVGLGWMQMIIPDFSINLDDMLKAIKNYITKEDARARLRQFLKDHPDCEGALAIAAQESGLSTKVWDAFEKHTFVDVRGDKNLLDSTLKDLRFPGQLGTAGIPLSTYVGEKGFANAMTNWKTSTVYLGYGFYDEAEKDENEANLIIIHELLHGLFNAGHSDIAYKLGLGEFPDTIEGEYAASHAIDAYLRRGCSY